MEHIPIFGLVLICLTSLPVTLCLSSQEVTNLTTHSQVTIKDSSESGYYEVSASGIPNHQTDNFPTSYNPNSIKAQNYKLTIPKEPTMASAISCLPMGPIGMTLSGVPVYNPNTADDNNAVEGDYAESFDMCDGHPSPNGGYHYHKIPSCIKQSSGSDQIVGIAFDGYPIYSNIDANGKEILSGDLDQCNGREVNGKYRYHMTKAYPYIMGCFKGNLHSSVKSTQNRGGCFTASTDGSGNNNNGAVGVLPVLSSAVMVTLGCLLFN